VRSDTTRMCSLLSGRREMPARRLNAIRELRDVTLRVGGVAADEASFYWDAVTEFDIRAETERLKIIYKWQLENPPPIEPPPKPKPRGRSVRTYNDGWPIRPAV
jgi:hypothetical protein